MATPVPGLDPRRVARLIFEAVRECELDLSGTTVLTEAASGAYVVTAVIAAVAGAKVFALTKATRHGSIEEVRSETQAVSRTAQVEDAIEIITSLDADTVARADIITNSGHIRPINAQLLSSCKPTVVIPLMYEAWEIREHDVELAYCVERSIPVAGTDERHPAVDVFSFLGPMAVKLLTDAGVAVYRSRLLLLCDNDFAPFIADGLLRSGATVDAVSSVTDAPGTWYDALVIALRPQSAAVLGFDDALTVAQRWPGAVVAQFWGDIDRNACARCGVPVWPGAAPMPGHMGILPSAIGPEPIVRLQAGGLKVGQILSAARRSGASCAASLEALRKTGYGTFLRNAGNAYPRTDTT